MADQLSLQIDYSLRHFRASNFTKFSIQCFSIRCNVLPGPVLTLSVCRVPPAPDQNVAPQVKRSRVSSMTHHLTASQTLSPNDDARRGGVFSPSLSPWHSTLHPKSSTRNFQEVNLQELGRKGYPVWWPYQKLKKPFCDQDEEQDKRLMAFSAVAEGKKMNENKRDAKKGKVSQKKKEREIEMEYVQRRQHENRVTW